MLLLYHIATATMIATLQYCVLCTVNGLRLAAVAHCYYDCQKAVLQYVLCTMDCMSLRYHRATTIVTLRYGSSSNQPTIDVCFFVCF